MGSEMCIRDRTTLGQRLYDLWNDPLETTDLLTAPSPPPGIELELRRLRALLGQL